jgi:hypothetical protein
MVMSNGEYDVGYKKPPKTGQFKPGESGNPAGRPKGTKNLKNDLQEEMSEKISVMERGNHVTYTKQQALVKTLSTKALKGDLRAINTLISLMNRLLVDEEDAIAEEKPVSTSDQALFDAFLKRHGVEK